MLRTTLLNLFLTLTAFSFLFVSCHKDDDDMDPSPGETTFRVSIENVSQATLFFQSGVFSVPVDASDAAPLFPGDAYEFTVQAGPHILPMDGGARLSFVTMMVQSDDLFYAPDESGIALYDENGNPIGDGSPEDVTDQVLLWDAGTEVNEMTGGPTQKPQQDPAAEDVGTDENGEVTAIEDNSDGVNVLPAVNEVIKVTITNRNSTEFLVRIENVSDASTIMTTNGTAAVPVSPGVWAVHNSDNPFFTAGAPASEGLEDIAEDGLTAVAAMAAADKTGLIVPLSPGAFAVHESGVNPLFMTGLPDFGEGLEAIAEDGVPTAAAAALAAKAGVLSEGLFNTPVGASDPGAIGPGGKYEFTFNAEPGAHLSMATMFVQSNDWFYAFPQNGIALFEGEMPVSGELTGSLRLYDAGTEADEFPGAGLHQPIRQSGADTGPVDDDSTVRVISDPPAIVPDLEQVIKVSISIAPQ